tara:strand:+ start:136 stop:483 length:348 start_codon:yes stop_codon:yes gene_type:complete
MQNLFYLIIFIFIFNGCASKKTYQEKYAYEHAKSMDLYRGKYIQRLLDKVRRLHDEVTQLPSGNYLYKWVHHKKIPSNHVLKNIETVPDCIKWVETDKNLIIVGGGYNDGCVDQK